MDAIEPVYGTATLLLIAAAAVALLLFLIMKVRLHAFISLVLVSLLTAVAAGIPVADVPTALLTGFSATLGSVALLVGFGVMLGRLLEVTGGAQVLADTLVNRFGEHRAPLALGVAALIFGFPIFFDAGLVVFLPIILTVARRFGGSVLYYALPAAGAFAAMHAIVPPHPGPVAAGTVLGGDIGVVLLVGRPGRRWSPGTSASTSSPASSGRRVFVPLPDLLFGEIERRPRRPSGSPPAAGPGAGRRRRRDARRAADCHARPRLRPRATAPAFGTVLGLLLVPLVLISGNTVLTTLVASRRARRGPRPGSRRSSCRQHARRAARHPARGDRACSAGRAASMSDTMAVLDQALGPICSIILITGAGGMFGGVLRTSGIGTALTSSLSDLGLPLLLQAFLIATALRVAQGSATVALTTTAGLIASQAAGLGNLHIALLVVADRRRRDGALARQRLGLLAGQPVLRDGREDHAEDVDGDGDDARASPPSRWRPSCGRSPRCCEVSAAGRGPRRPRRRWRSSRHGPRPARRTATASATTWCRRARLGLGGRRHQVVVGATAQHLLDHVAERGEHRVPRGPQQQPVEGDVVLEERRQVAGRAGGLQQPGEPDHLGALVRRRRARAASAADVGSTAARSWESSRRWSRRPSPSSRHRISAGS